MIKMNLLPPEQKKRIKILILYRDIISSGLILFLLFLLLIIFLGGSLTFLNMQYLAFEKDINDQQSRIIQTETLKTIQNRIKELNDGILAIKKIEDSKSDLYEVLDRINEEIFQGVKIYSLQIDNDSKLITVSGYSSSRENLVAIRKILNGDSHYKEVDFPLSNLANPTNINFRFSFTYNQ
jgi:predicted RND superfamily exporter protein